MARMFGPDVARSGGPSRLFLTAVISCNVFLVFVTLYHNSHARTQWKQVDEELKTSALISESLLQRFDNLSIQIRTSLRANLLTSTAVTSMDPPNIVVRAAHRGPRRLCSYSEQELRGILALRHACGYYQQRYYYRGAWMDWTWLHREFQEEGPGVPPGEKGSREPECVLACRYQEEYHCSRDVPCIHAFYLRRKSSDTRVLRQLYEWAEHNFLKPSLPLHTILDAGANIGIASVMFATMFPEATIVSVEASSHNFRALRLNAEPYPNIIPVNAALWPRAVPLSLVRGPRNPDKPPEWGYMVVESSELGKSQVVEDSLVGVSVPFLLRVFGLPSFDFVKLDIEGGEGKLLETDSPASTGWVDRAKLVAFELHGDMVPGSNVTVREFFRRRPNFVPFVDPRLLEDYVVFKRKDALPA